MSGPTTPANPAGATEVASPSPPRLGTQIPALDGVRGLAILGVLLFHFVAGAQPTNGFEAAIQRVLGFGARGVDLFFILSGFLITGILVDSHTSPDYYRSFYMRRLLRIFPLYYVVLFVVFVLLPLVPALRGSEIVGLKQHQAWAWLYAVNIWLTIRGDWDFSYLQHFWSLAVEEHFYLVWPLLVGWLAPTPRRLMRVALAVALASLAGRVLLSLCGAPEIVGIVLTPFQLDALCLGGFLAVYARQPDGMAAVTGLVRPLAAWSIGFGLLAFAWSRVAEFGVLVTRPLMSGAMRLVLAALLLLALVSPARSLAGRFFGSGWLRTLGKYSYGLYVYHHFASHYLTTHRTEFILARLVGSHALAVAIQALGGFAVSMLVAWLSYEFFEKRFLELKRFFPTTRGRSGNVREPSEGGGG